MRKRRTVRKALVALALCASLALLTAGTTFAGAPHHVTISDAACNPGTTAARQVSGNDIVPMYMAPIGCMTMPGA